MERIEQLRNQKIDTVEVMRRAYSDVSDCEQYVEWCICQIQDNDEESDYKNKALKKLNKINDELRMLDEMLFEYSQNNWLIRRMKEKSNKSN